jgi:hypothetical protein
MLTVAEMLDRVADWLDGTVRLSKYVRVHRRGNVSIDARHYFESPRWPQTRAALVKLSTSGSTEGRAASAGQSQPASRVGDGSGQVPAVSADGNHAPQAGIKAGPLTHQ